MSQETTLPLGEQTSLMFEADGYKAIIRKAIENENGYETLDFTIYLHEQPIRIEAVGTLKTLYQELKIMKKLLDLTKEDEMKIATFLNINSRVMNSLGTLIKPVPVLEQELLEGDKEGKKKSSPYCNIPLVYLQFAQKVIDVVAESESEE